MVPRKGLTEPGQEAPPPGKGAPPPGQRGNPRPHSCTFPTMGTLGRISWSGAVDETELFPAIFARIQEIEARLTRFREDSEISQLDGQWRAVGADTEAVLSAAQLHQAGTGGHFSALLGAQMRSWARIAGGASGARSSESAGTDRARSEPLAPPHPAVGSLEVEGSRCRVIGAPPRAVDLGGIAKGYAADQLRDLAVALGADDVLVSLGTSSMAVAGAPARIGLASPWAGWERAGVLTLARGALAVSADPGTMPGQVRQHSHVLDPATGAPAITDLCCVVVCGADGMACEAYSTAFLAMGLDAALELDAAHPELATMFLTVNGRMLASPALGFAARRGLQDWLVSNR